MSDEAASRLMLIIALLVGICLIGSGVGTAMEVRPAWAAGRTFVAIVKGTFATGTGAAAIGAFYVAVLIIGTMLEEARDKKRRTAELERWNNERLVREIMDR